ncbi:hypothetical protein KFL_003130050 [Klebsormidium nitens]|uniref:Mitochondrial transcription termination factor family protein n=1 Tax=Klebsormidium nitens TaxID=105231 RepID=A0A1Y1IDN9_KLENI|nr:hypothetical protein KFL_003130050 [Klebsormidium nitens]|eukprot:GAQ86816.1 hypothetical protein KFL_003130050 [Klebsormidium nitens]
MQPLLAMELIGDLASHLCKASARSRGSAVSEQPQVAERNRENPRTSDNASGGKEQEREQNGGANSISIGNGEGDTLRDAVFGKSSDGADGQRVPTGGNPKTDSSVDAAAVPLSFTTPQHFDSQDTTLPASSSEPSAAAETPPGPGTPYADEGTPYAYEGRSYEWRLQQAAQVVAVQLQSEGVEASEAIHIAAAAPQYCRSLVEKVSEMDGPPDIWADLGLLDGGVESAGRNMPLEEAGKSVENEEEASVSGRGGSKLTSAFASAYQLSGVPEPSPQEKREKVSKGKKAAGGGPGGVEASPRSRRKREWKLRGVRRRAEEQSELEELLGIGPTRGEPYRLAEWEKEQAAVENGGEGELEIDGGKEGGESTAGGEGLQKDRSVSGGTNQTESRIGFENEDGLTTGAVDGTNAGGVNGDEAGGVNGTEGAGADEERQSFESALDQLGEGPHGNLAKGRGSEGAESSESMGESSYRGASADIGFGNISDVSGSEASGSFASDSSPQIGEENGMAVEGSEAESTTESSDQDTAAYCWKLRWCADESRGGGSLPPFFESLGIPPHEIKRILRVLKRSRGPKGRAVLPITEIITRVRVFERLFGCADGLGAAERILVRGRDETLSRMREDDDIERNVRYLEAAVAAVREWEIRAAKSSPVSNPSSSLDGGFRRGSDEVESQRVDYPSAQASHGGVDSEVDGLSEAGEIDSLSDLSQAQSASAHVGLGSSASSAAIEALKGSPSKVQQNSPPSPSQLADLSSGTDDGVSSANPARYDGNPVANPSTNLVTESESAASNPSSCLSTTAEPPSDQPLTSANPSSRGLGQSANTPVNPDPNSVTREATLVTPNPNPGARGSPWGASLVVSSFPELLFPSLETKNFERVAEYMEREVGMTSAEAANALLLFPPAFALDVETELKPRMRDLKSILRISWSDLARMIGRWPYVLSETAYVAAIPTVDFLYREALVAIDTVGKVVAGLPHILFCDINGLLRPSLQLLLNVGVQHKRAHIGLVVTKCPQALLKGPARLAAVIDFLETEADIPPTRTEKLLLTVPELLGTRLEVPREKLDFLYDLGLTEGQVGKVVGWKPRVLLTSVQGLEERVSFFERLGLSRHELAYMVEQFPDLLTYSVRGNFQPKVDYLVNEMGRPVDELVRFPRFFSFSLDTRIKPRHEGARAAGSFDRLVSISALLTPNDVRFREAFLGAREQRSAIGRDQSEIRPGDVRRVWRSGRESREGRSDLSDSTER